MRVYLRSFFLSFVILSCVTSAFFGMAKAYENIRLIGFGEYRNAVEIEEGKLRFFDLEIDLH